MQRAEADRLRTQAGYLLCDKLAEMEPEEPLAEATMRRIAKGLCTTSSTRPTPSSRPDDALTASARAKRHARLMSTRRSRPFAAGGKKHALVTAFMAQHNTGNDGHDARRPVSTIV